jgi:hypothetical protein
MDYEPLKLKALGHIENSELLRWSHDIRKLNIRLEASPNQKN